MSYLFDKTDSELKQDVIDELMADPSVNSKEIHVDAYDGIVTLFGSVPHYFQKATADVAAQRVSGVRAVADELEVSLFKRKSDQQIAKAALDVFRYTISIPAGIQIKVEKGWVTLTGEVDWDFERTATRNSVSFLEGVCGITNSITLKSNSKTEEVQTRIEAALKRSALTDSQTIKVVTEGGHVTLSGHCRSLTEVNDATHAAWMAPGVTDVTNNINVN